LATPQYSACHYRRENGVLQERVRVYGNAINGENDGEISISPLPLGKTLLLGMSTNRRGTFHERHTDL